MYPEMSDEKLLQFYLSGNTAALATLTDLYKDRIYTTIFGMVQDKHVAEDIFRALERCREHPHKGRSHTYQARNQQEVYDDSHGS